MQISERVRRVSGVVIKVFTDTVMNKCCLDQTLPCG